MSDQGQPGPPEPGDVFGEVPLFREISRVLAASHGPVNWELARQVGIAAATMSGGDPVPGPAEARDLAETVRAAELAVADLTGLPAPSDVAEVRPVRRAQWIEANIASLRELVDPMAEKLAASLRSMPGLGLPGGPESGSAQPPALPGFPQGPGGPAGLEQLMQGVGPLLLGAQVGTVLGELAQRVFGQYDLPIPRPPGPLLFVVTNIAAFERDWSLPSMELRAWVALHEVAHRFEFARPWAREHVVSLVRDLVAHAEVDLSGLQRAIETMDISNPEALMGALEEFGNPFGHAQTGEQRLRLERVQAFVAFSEAYGDHVSEILGRRMLASYDRIEEALRRHREGRHSERALERLFGVDMTEEQHALARRFCGTVVERSDEVTLARAWERADALPSMVELQEPTLWLARTV